MAPVVRIGDNVVLATACANPEPREGIDFFPLTVDYREYTYAGGRIPGGFIKREGRPSEREILTSRQIDRPIRPLFPEGFRCETQVIAMVLSADTENDPDVAGINGASAALSVSDIPFHGPIGAVRVGLVDGEFVINPTYDEQRDGRAEPDGRRHGRRHRDDRVRRERSVGRDASSTPSSSVTSRSRKSAPPSANCAQKAASRSARSSRRRSTRRTSTSCARKIGERLTDAINTEKYPKNESYATDQGDSRTN